MHPIKMRLYRYHVECCEGEVLAGLSVFAECAMHSVFVKQLTKTDRLTQHFPVALDFDFFLCLIAY